MCQLFKNPGKMLMILVLMFVGSFTTLSADDEDAKSANESETVEVVSDGTSTDVDVEKTSVYEQDPDRETDWVVVVAPMYLWATSLKGDVTVKGNKSEVDMSFSDLLDDLEYLIGGHFDVRKGRFGLILEPWYYKFAMDDSIKMSTSIPIPEGLLPPPAPDAIPASVKADVDVTLRMTLVELYAYYRAVEKTLGDSATSEQSRQMAIDVFSGIRYWRLSVRTDIDTKVAIGPLRKSGSMTIKGDQEWVDPIVGARFSYDLLENLKFVARGDVGGFGVGSDFTWSASALINYSFLNHCSVIAGYRHLEVDYSDGSGSNKFEFDAALSGPILGFAFFWDL